MLIDELKQITKPIFFVTNDVSRAIGLEKVFPNYHIICLDDHPLVDLLQNEGVSVFCLEKELNQKNVISRSSGIILEHPLVTAFIKEKAGLQSPNILFFKPQKKLEILAERFGYNLLGNRADKARIFEDKISFLKIIKDCGITTPLAEIATLSEIEFDKCVKNYSLPFVLQFGYGWAGNSTYFINDAESLNEIKNKYGKLRIKISKFIYGITLINNAVVTDNLVFQSLPAIQIKTEPLLTSTNAATGGRQWPALTDQSVNEEIESVTEKVGQVMRTNGCFGFFGLDFVVEKETNKVFLIEDNCRLTASCSFYTQLELLQGRDPLLARHVLTFLEPSLAEQTDSGETVPLKGSEIVVRNNQTISVLVTKSVSPGIYDQDLNLTRETALFDHMTEEDMFISCADLGRKVDPEIELIRINTIKEVCDREGNLKEEFRSIIKSVKSNLELQDAKN